MMSRFVGMSPNTIRPVRYRTWSGARKHVMRWFGRPQATIALPSGAENVNLKLRETMSAQLEGMIATAWGQTRCLP